MCDAYDFIKVLFEKGVDLSIVNNEGKTCKDVAIGKCRSLFENIKQLKVIIVGKAEVGKTTLVKRIIKPEKESYINKAFNVFKREGRTAQKSNEESKTSDIYSFGVLPCELVANDSSYANNLDRLKMKLENHLLKIIIEECLQPESTKRPNTSQLLEKFEQLRNNDYSNFHFSISNNNDNITPSKQSSFLKPNKEETQRKIKEEERQRRRKEEEKKRKIKEERQRRREEEKKRREEEEERKIQLRNWILKLDLPN